MLFMLATAPPITKTKPSGGIPVQSLALTALIALFVAPAYAEQQDLLKFTGPNVLGQSTLAQYQNWIDIRDIKWSVTAETSFSPGGAPSVGKPVVSDVRWRQQWEPSVNDLLAQITQGKGFVQTEIHTLDGSILNSPGHVRRRWTMDGLFLTGVDLDGFDDVAVSGTFKSLKLEIDSNPDDQRGYTALNFSVPTAQASVSGLAPQIALGAGAPLQMAGSDVRAFLRLDPEIAGNVSVKGYENWIELDALSFDVGATTTWSKGGGVSVGKPVPGSLIWSQSFDETVLATLHRLMTGSAVSESVIELVKAGPLGPVTFAQMSFTGALFSEIAVDDDEVRQQVFFRTLSQTIFAVDEAGIRKGGTTFTWDVETGISVLSTTPKLAPLLKEFGTGMLNPRPQASGSDASIPGQATVVPVPPAWGLMLAGVALLARVRRRVDS